MNLTVTTDHLLLLPLYRQSYHQDKLTHGVFVYVGTLLSRNSVTRKLKQVRPLIVLPKFLCYGGGSFFRNYTTFTKFCIFTYNT